MYLRTKQKKIGGLSEVIGGVLPKGQREKKERKGGGGGREKGADRTRTQQLNEIAKKG